MTKVSATPNVLNSQVQRHPQRHTNPRKHPEQEPAAKPRKPSKTDPHRGHHIDMQA